MARAKPLEGGSLGNSPIRWRHLELLNDGAVIERFQIVQGHGSGHDLQAQVEAGTAIGFGTFGTADTAC